jgi:hypothetical protein
VYNSQRSEIFTDFRSRFTRLRRGLPAVRLEGLPAVFFTSLWLVYPPVVWRTGGFIRRLLGGLFSVKEGSVKRNAHQLLSVMLTKPFIHCLKER